MNVSNIWDTLWGNVDDFEIATDIDKAGDAWTQIHRAKIETIFSSLRPGAKFLEAGCGLGQWCFYAAKKYQIQSTGVDIAPQTIRRLQQYVQNTSNKKMVFIEDDLNNTTLPSDFFDFFISLGVIEHFPNSQPMLRNLFKVLKKGGVGLISTPNIFSFHTISRPIARLLGKWEIGYEKSFSPKGLENIAESCGFKVTERGILPSGFIFGCTLNRFFPFLKTLSNCIEHNQNTIGFVSYIVVTNQ